MALAYILSSLDMYNQVVTVDELRIRYDDLAPRLERLGSNLVHAIEEFLQQHNVDFLTVTCRVKTFTSFREKIQRKRYEEPFAQIPDLCGIRVIVFNPSDLSRIDSVIRSEFVIHETVNQGTKLQEDQFGYRSNHYVVTLRDEWLRAPNYRGLGSVRAEIQVRTILMHAWANLSHRMAYKSADQAPLEFRRRIFQLSALFELADEEFDRLNVERLRFREGLLQDAARNPAGFNTTQSLNLDTLQAYLDYRFPDRGRSPEDTSRLLAEMNDANISLEMLERGFEILRDVLRQQDIEMKADAKAAGDIRDEIDADGKPHWYQTGAARHILDVTVDRYWDKRRTTLPEYVRAAVERYRGELSVDSVPKRPNSR